jgi:IclR family acetate operon transcriptional repressor
VGKAILAFLPQQVVTSIVEQHGLPALTPRTITDVAALQRELARIRKQGYAIDDVENEEGIRCVGAPIFDYRGRPVAALSLSGPAFRLTRERAEGLSGAVRRAARSVSQQLGYPG